MGALWVATATPGGPPDRAFLEQTLTSVLQMGQRAFRGTHLAFLARLDAAAGDLDRADEHLADAEKLPIVRRNWTPREDLHRR